MQRLKAFGLRLLAVWRKRIQNSEGEEETGKIHALASLKNKKKTVSSFIFMEIWIEICGLHFADKSFYLVTHQHYIRIPSLFILGFVLVQKVLVPMTTKILESLGRFSSLSDCGWNPLWRYFIKSRRFSNFGHCEYFGGRK